MSQPFVPENYNKLDEAEKKELIVTHLTDVDVMTAIRSCGDGREALDTKEAFAKIFGGSLGPAMVRYISDRIDNRDIDFLDSVTESFQTLTGAGFSIGVHRDDHSEGENSGCGFGDGRATITARALSMRDLEGTIEIVFGNTPAGGNDAEQHKPIMETLQQIATVEDFPSGEQIIAHAEKLGAKTTVLTGSHEEQDISISFVTGKTLDTNKVIKSGGSLFHVDMWDAMNQARALGVPDERAAQIYKIDTLATNQVLNVDKGKNLDVFAITEADLAV